MVEMCGEQGEVKNGKNITGRKMLSKGMLTLSADLQRFIYYLGVII